MKRLIASRKLKRKCITCNGSIKKGNVYYKHRTVYNIFGDILAFENLECAKCNYKGQMHTLRFIRLVENCHHPEELIQQVYETMPGEPHLLEPSHCECKICGMKF